MEELIPITMFISIAAVAILRPISTKLGGLLEAMRNERNAAVSGSDDPDLSRVRVLMEHMSKRLDLMEERMDFTERLLNGRGRRDDDIGARDLGPRRSHGDLMHGRDADALRP